MCRKVKTVKKQYGNFQPTKISGKYSKADSHKPWQQWANIFAHLNMLDGFTAILQ